jgi:chromosomal replication initiation ATPase DnaA
MKSKHDLQKEGILKIITDAEEKIGKITGRTVELIYYFKNKNQDMFPSVARDFINYAEKKTGYSYEELCSPSRKRDLRATRQIIGKILFEQTQLSSSQVGKILKRDHATILHGSKIKTALQKKKFDELLKVYTEFMKETFRG